jgi:hypothetical protein
MGVGESDRGAVLSPAALIIARIVKVHGKPFRAITGPGIDELRFPTKNSGGSRIDDFDLEAFVYEQFGFVLTDGMTKRIVDGLDIIARSGQ